MAGTPFVGIVIPTVAGREESLRRCVASYNRTLEPAEIPYAIHIERDRPTCGDAWNRAVWHFMTERLPQTPSTRRPNIIHLTADDIEAHEGWFEAGYSRLRHHHLPAARILHGDGTLQSCGDEHEHEDGFETEIPRIPLLPAELAAVIFPIPEDMHYYTDNVVGDRARAHGWPTVVERAYEFTHHLAGEGRLDRLDLDYWNWIGSRG